MRLGNCPPGLFIFNGPTGPMLGFKSEYRTSIMDAADHIIDSQTDAYVVSSGEYFWGGTNGDRKKRENLKVDPIDEEMIQLALEQIAASRKP